MEWAEWETEKCVAELGAAAGRVEYVRGGMRRRWGGWGGFSGRGSMGS